MGKYTISKQADKKIGSDMAVIVREIQERIPSVISIILTGGFARGERPVKKIKGKFVPYNDYDIQIICPAKLSKGEIDKIATEISKGLGYGGIKEIFYPFKKENQKMGDNFYVDLKCDTPEDLKKLLPRIRTYELKNDSLVLWGRDVRKLIPDYALKDVPISEGAKLLLDRMSQMIEYYSTEGRHDKEVLTYFIQQAYAACCTALLLLKGKYQLGYNRSMKILKEDYQEDFPELYKKIPDLHLKVEQFINWKMNPQKLPNSDVEAEWFIAKNNILWVSKYFFSKFLNKKTGNVGELADAILKMQKKFYVPYIRDMTQNKFGFNLGFLNVFALPFVSFILKYKYYQRLKIFRVRKPGVIFGKSPDLVIFASLIFLISAVDENGIDKKLLQRGQKLLKRVYPSGGKNWEEISLDYANAYIAFFLQKL